MTAFRRLKFLLEEPLKYGATESGRPLDDSSCVRYIRITDIDSNGNLRSDDPVFLTISEASTYDVQPGDILLARSGATVGKAFMYNSNEPACFAGYLIRARVNTAKANPRFLYYFFQSDAYWEYVRSYYSQATIQNLNATLYGTIPVPYPSLSSQAEVVTFLDRETAKADALVAKYERLIELLEEKRVALITGAVTKGINDSCAMKDTNAQSWGQVPDGWDVVPLKRCCTLLKDGTHLPPPRVNAGIPLLSVRNIANGTFGLREDDSFITEENYLELCRAFVPMPGDVLLAIVGATLGKTALIPDNLGKFQIQRSLAIFRATSAMIPEWLVFVFRSQTFQHLLWESVGYSAQPGIYLGSLANFRIPLPPLSAQREIVAFLEKEISQIDKISSKARKAIALIQEHRSALITAAVTGQIDVRTYQSKEREEVVA